MTALPLLLRGEPRPAVIVASALTQRGAAATMAALRAGAADYIPKPGAAGGREAAVVVMQTGNCSAVELHRQVSTTTLSYEFYVVGTVHMQVPLEGLKPPTSSL